MTKIRSSIATLLGGAAVDRDILSQALRLAPQLYCADGGANTAVKLGVSPVAVIGDLDSISSEAEAKLDCPVHLVEDQNSTDFEKCLGFIPDNILICLGFLGQRLDHSLAAMNALAKFPNKRAILVGDGDICFLAPREIDFKAEVGDRVSLFPLTRTHAKSRGLLWPLDRLEFTPTGQIATSNQAARTMVQLYDISGSALVILPVRFLDQIVKRMVSTPAN
jgi:thiamine pyrophosphokinase